jgi:hypothetical protein
MNNTYVQKKGNEIVSDEEGIVTKKNTLQRLIAEKASATLIDDIYNLFRSQLVDSKYIGVDSGVNIR